MVIFQSCFLLSPLFHKAAEAPRPSFLAADRHQFPLGLGSFSVEQDEPPSPDFSAKVRDRWIRGCLLPVDALLGTGEEQRGRDQEGGAKPRCLVGWRSWNHLERFFCGKSKDQGGWEKGCHDNLWGFPRKPWSPWQLHHSGRN